MQCMCWSACADLEEGLHSGTDLGPAARIILIHQLGNQGQEEYGGPLVQQGGG